MNRAAAFGLLATAGGTLSTVWRVLFGLETCTVANVCVARPIWSDGFGPFLLGLVTTPLSFVVGLLASGIVLWIAAWVMTAIAWPFTRLRGTDGDHASAPQLAQRTTIRPVAGSSSGAIVLEPTTSARPGQTHLNGLAHCWQLA